MAEEKSVSSNTAPADPKPAQSPEKQSGSFVPLIFGGAVACALGFFGGQIDAIEQRFGFGEGRDLTALIETQAGTLDSQAAQIARLTDRITAAEAIEVPEIDLSEITGAIEEQAATVVQLTARLADLEKRPMTEGVSEAAIAAYENELQRLQSSVAAQRDEIENLLGEARESESSAAEKARIALARAAMSRIITAVDSGAPYAEALADLQNSGDVEIPAILIENAENGVPTLAALRESFPANARAALSAARSGTTGGSFSGFLQKQLGVRSVEPRDGTDADAILSRTEASVRDGRLGDALAEIDGLPDAASAAMADWTALAETRHAARVAADDLMTALATN